MTQISSAAINNQAQITRAVISRHTSAATTAIRKHAAVAAAAGRKHAQTAKVVIDRQTQVAKIAMEKHAPGLKAFLDKNCGDDPHAVVMGVILVVLFIWILLTPSTSSANLIEQNMVGKAPGKPAAIRIQPKEILGSNGGIVAAVRPYDPNAAPYKPKFIDDNRVIFNSYAKKSDGLVMRDVVMAHAHAYEEGVLYGGACGGDLTNHDTHRAMLDALGLGEEIQFRCSHDLDDQSVRSSTVSDYQYKKRGMKLFTAEYREFLRSKVAFPPKADNRFTIAVHIRRGRSYDSPCTAKMQHGYLRYLPNSHYQRLIDVAMRPGARVVIYSHAPSVEDFDDFRKRGYEVHIDEDVGEAWKTMVSSDVLIMSRSMFTLIPALVHKGRVLYTPFWEKPIDSWDVASNELLKATNEELDELKGQLGCGTE